MSSRLAFFFLALVALVTSSRVLAQHPVAPAVPAKVILDDDDDDASSNERKKENADDADEMRIVAIFVFSVSFASGCFSTVHVFPPYKTLHLAPENDKARRTDVKDAENKSVD